MIHGGTGGIGSLALQIAKLFGATVISTSRDEKRCSLCRNLGADYAINYSIQDFAIEVLRATDGKGVDVILDHVGSNYFPRHLELLKRKGRLILLDATSGEKCSLDLGKVITKHLLITGSTLRPRSLDEKQRISDAVKESLLPKVQAGLIKPLIDRILPFSQATEAHQIIRRGEHVGKIILQVETEKK